MSVTEVLNGIGVVLSGSGVILYILAWRTNRATARKTEAEADLSEITSVRQLRAAYKDFISDYAEYKQIQDLKFVNMEQEINTLHATIKTQTERCHACPNNETN
jgi:hypothetical protein